MDTPDAPDTNRWIDERLRALDPPDTWEPSTAIALARFRQRADAAAAATNSGAADARRGFGFTLRRRGWAWMAAASLVCVIVLITPATRATAQRLWDVFFAERVEFVTLDVDKLPRSLTEQNIRINGANTEVASIEEAASYVGFTPRLPDGALVPQADGNPRFQVAGAISLESRVKVDELELAARHARLFDVHFPREWDGAQIAVHSSAIVTADYMTFQLLQVMPLAITTPPDFDLAAFTERILRIGGLAPAEARAFSAQMTTAPFALCAISPEEKVTMRKVQLRVGEGTLIHDMDEEGKLQRTTLVWNTPDRLYALSSYLSDDELIAIANAVPQP